MNKRLLFLYLSVFISLNAFAGVFNKKGAVDQFQWAPEYYKTGFKYDVLYYIPTKLKTTDGANSMIFLHGGGQSTMTRAGSLNVANSYINDLKAIAEAQGFIIVAPSGSGLNWGGHMRGMLRELAQLMREKLKVNSNKMALAGHSMGGMGITRTAHWLTDTFAFFMPMAAGMDPKHALEPYLATYFNTTYYHLQGLNDHFKVFIERCQNQTKEVEKLESMYSRKSGFKVEYYNGSHNYDKNLVSKRLTEMYTHKIRNLFQNELYGILYWTDREVEENSIKYNLASNKSYFWVEALEFEQITDVVAYSTNFKAKIDNNEIRIDFKDRPRIKKLRLYFNEKMINFGKKLEVFVNDQLVYDAIPVIKSAEMTKIKLEKADPNFNYTSFVDITL